MSRIVISIALCVLLALAVLGTGGVLFLIPHNDPNFDFKLTLGGGAALGGLLILLIFVIPQELRNRSK